MSRSLYYWDPSTLRLLLLFIHLGGYPLPEYLTLYQLESKPLLCAPFELIQILVSDNPIISKYHD